MGRPRKYKRPQIKRKCQSCGKMAWLPYTRTEVPAQGFYFDYAPPLKEKQPRAERKGLEKCNIKHYCNEQCYKESEFKLK